MKLALLLVLVLPAMAAKVRVQDTYYSGYGQLANGVIELTWPSFTTAAGESVLAGTYSYPLIRGKVDLSLYPTLGAEPTGVAYTATFRLSGGVKFQETWGVPALAGPITLRDLRKTSTLLIFPSQIDDGGAGVALGWVLTKTGAGAAWQAPTGGPGGPGAVSSVFGRTGVITPQPGDYTTDQVTEGNNQYFNGGRVRAALSAAAPILFNSATGAFSCPTCLTSSSAAGGDATGTLGALTVATVGGSTAGQVHSAALVANAASSQNTPNAVVQRDAQGNFSAGTISANLQGNVAGNASTASALAAAPGGCPAGQFTTRIAADGTPTCTTPAGGGDVSGPGSSVNGNLPIFSGISGKLLADGGKGLPAGAVVGTTDAQSVTNKTLDSTNSVDGAALKSGTVAAARIGDLSGTYIAVTQKAAASGVATLDSGSKIPVGQIPSLNYEPANVNIQAHIARTDNPHGTTAAQVGAAATSHTQAAATITDFQTTVSANSDVAASKAAQHAQGTDQGLDSGGANAVTAAQAKTAYTHSQASGNPHGTTAAQVGAEPADANILKKDAAGNVTIRTTVLGPLTIGAGANQLPAAAAGNAGWLTVVTDAASGSDCTVGGGTSAALCRSNGSAWVPLGGGGGGGVGQAIDTSGPVTVATTSGYDWNNSSGALTYNLPTITSAMVTAGYSRCFGNLYSRSGAITLQAPASTYIALYGEVKSAAGTLVSSGALGDSVCVVAVDTTHYQATGVAGNWTNN
jgi:hypothetical protein